MRPTHELAQTPLFRHNPDGLSVDERIRLSYQRARAMALAYGQTPRDLSLAPIADDLTALTAKDLITLSPKFWQLHTDPMFCMDGAAGTLVTIQYNLCGGTLATFAASQPELREPLQKVLRFEVSYVSFTYIISHFSLGVFRSEASFV